MNKMISDHNVLTSAILCCSLLYHYSHLCSSPVSEGKLVLCSKQHFLFATKPARSVSLLNTA